MPSKPRGVILHFHCHSYVRYIGEVLSSYLTILHGQPPVYALGLSQGVWIDKEKVVNLLSFMIRLSAGSVWRFVRVPETIGTNRIWVRCWVDAAAGTVTRADYKVAGSPEHRGDEDVKTDPLAQPASFTTSRAGPCSRFKKVRVLTPMGTAPYARRRLTQTKQEGYLDHA